MDNKIEICRACGAPIEIKQNISCIECEYCGSIFYLEEKNRKNQIKEKASELFKACDFDSAKKLYQSIVFEESDAEAYWFITLCKYGIQFVDDDKTQKKIPTCHRTLYAPILKDEDYLSAIDNANIEARQFYENMAKKIDALQKKIISVVDNEKPCDVFICYKETGKDGNPTEESKLARDLYYKLMMAGYTVFYAPETLRDKAGYEFEPYIYSAISSAKVMFVIGFEKDNYNAVWVKNEWSRFLLRKATNQFLRIVCCYRSIIATLDIIPDELENAQIIDLLNVSTNDLVEEVKVWIPIKKEPEKVVVSEKRLGNPEALFKRGNIHIKDKKFADAVDAFNKCLDADPNFGEAYWSLLLAKSNCATDEDLLSKGACISETPEYVNAIKNSSPERKNHFTKIAQTIDQKINIYLEKPLLTRNETITHKLQTKAVIEKNIEETIGKNKSLLSRLKEVENKIKENIFEVRGKLSEYQITIDKYTSSFFDSMIKLKEKDYSWIRLLRLDSDYLKVSKPLEKAIKDAKYERLNGTNAMEIKKLIKSRKEIKEQIIVENQNLDSLTAELRKVCDEIKDIDKEYRTLERKAKNGILEK